MNQIVSRVSKRKRAIGGLAITALLASGLLVGAQQGWTESVAPPPGEDVPNSPGDLEDVPTLVVTQDESGTTFTVTDSKGNFFQVKIPSDGSPWEYNGTLAGKDGSVSVAGKGDASPTITGTIPIDKGKVTVVYTAPKGVGFGYSGPLGSHKGNPIGFDLKINPGFKGGSVALTYSH